MSSTINIRYGSTDIPLPTPTWGYTSTIDLPLWITKNDDKSYDTWDDGAGATTYDRRSVSCVWLLNLADTNSLVDIFTNVAKGRGGDLTLKLGTNSGFYPFGPDRGDSGNFTVKLLSVNQKPSIGHPQDYFNVEVRLANTGSYPAYSLPDQFTEGHLQIGTISGLRYPQSMHLQNIQMATSAIQKNNSEVASIDRSIDGDGSDCTLPLTLMQCNAAALINHLTATVRAGTVDIIPPANSYLFGRQNGSTATYTCKWIQNQISIINTNFNSFDFELNFHRISQA